MKEVLRAIRVFCLTYCQGLGGGGSPAEFFEDVRLCADEACPLWPYRMGVNPAKSESRVRAGQKLAEAQKQRPEGDKVVTVVVGGDPRCGFDSFK